jgi:UDP-N-acetyl-D-mannosaminuronate dehydrogenase
MRRLPVRTGHEVIGVDISQDKIDLINAGKSPIVEPGLGELSQGIARPAACAAPPTLLRPSAKATCR